MKFLIDECLHTSLVGVALDRGHEGTHVTWLGLAGEKDWDLMPRIIAGDFIFVTNNARDFRKLYAKEVIHSGLIIIVPQVVPSLQRQLFEVVLANLGNEIEPVNEAIEVTVEGETAVITRYALSR